MTRAGVLLTTRNLPPLQGGMERLNAHLAQALGAEFTLYLCGPNGVDGKALGARRSIAAPNLGLAGFLLTNFVATLWMAIRYRPQLVLAGSGLTAPAAWCAARLCGARSAAYLHGLDIVVDNALYRRLWLPFIRRLDACLANSRSTAAHAESAGVIKDRITILAPGVEWPALPGLDATTFRARHALGDGPLLLSLGRLTARKGLAEFVERVLPSLRAAVPDLQLIIIGREPAEALKHGQGERARIEAAAKRHGLQTAVRLLGGLSDDEVVGAMLASRALVFPVLDLPGDSEGFGMVAVESAAQGLPTVAFRVGGVGDAVADGVSGDLLAPADYAGLAQALLRRLAQAADPQTRAACQQFAAGFAWSEFGGRLVDWVRGVVSR